MADGTDFAMTEISFSSVKTVTRPAPAWKAALAARTTAPVYLPLPPIMATEPLVFL